jgi:predicted enzyme related to lactoylglutathione lyase
MDANVNILNWFEVSVSDMARAKAFYQAVFAVEMHEMDMMGMKMAFFPANPGNGKLSGALVQSATHTPSAHGAKLYFNGNPDLAVALSRVEAAGGKVVMPKTLIDEQTGYMAFFADTEGNELAMHSQD